MNAANYAIFIALEKVLALNHVEVNILCKNFYSFLWILILILLKLILGYTNIFRTVTRTS